VFVCCCACVCVPGKKGDGWVSSSRRGRFHFTCKCIFVLCSTHFLAQALCPPKALPSSAPRSSCPCPSLLKFNHRVQLFLDTILYSPTHPRRSFTTSLERGHVPNVSLPLWRSVGLCQFPLLHFPLNLTSLPTPTLLSIPTPPCSYTELSPSLCCLALPVRKPPRRRRRRLRSLSPFPTFSPPSSLFSSASPTTGCYRSTASSSSCPSKPQSPPTFSYSFIMAPSQHQTTLSQTASRRPAASGMSTFSKNTPGIFLVLVLLLAAATTQAFLIPSPPLASTALLARRTMTTTTTRVMGAATNEKAEAVDFDTSSSSAKVCREGGRHVGRGGVRGRGKRTCAKQKGC